MDHPDITKIERTGYLYDEPKLIGVDDLGVEIYNHDEVYEINDRKYVKSMLSSDAIQILEQLGAEIKR